MVIKEVTDLKNILAAFSLLKENYPDLTLEMMQSQVEQMLAAQIKFLLVYEETEIVAFASYWLGTRFYSGSFIQIESVVVRKDKQNQAIGNKIIDYVEDIGRKASCQKYVLDVFVENDKAQKLYLRKGFCHRGFHLTKDI